MVNMSFRGLMPPVFTPFNDDFTINFALIPDYVKYLHKQNVGGILVNGTSGEGMSMTVHERKSLAEAWTKAAHEHGIHVMVHVGGAPMPDVVELTKHAESIRVDSILCLPELFNKPTDTDELVEYLHNVSKHAPRTPFLYYHNPGLTCVNLDMADMVTKARSRIPTFRGLKYTSTDLKMGIAAREACQDECVLFLGADQLLVSGHAMGIDSSIGTTYNMMHSLAHSITSSMPDKLSEARRNQGIMIRAIDCVSKHGKWVSTMKVAMETLTGIKVGPPRPPLKPLAESQKAQMRKELSELGFSVQ